MRNLIREDLHAGNLHRIAANDETISRNKLVMEQTILRRITAQQKDGDVAWMDYHDDTDTPKAEAIAAFLYVFNGALRVGICVTV